MADVVIDKELGGRPSGEAFVRFASKQHAEMALERNRNNMGSRYGQINITCYLPLFNEINQASDLPSELSRSQK